MITSSSLDNKTYIVKVLFYYDVPNSNPKFFEIEKEQTLRFPNLKEAVDVHKAALRNPVTDVMMYTLDDETGEVRKLNYMEQKRKEEWMKK